VHYSRAKESSSTSSRHVTTTSRLT
jgi:hypothetical protein